MKSNGNDCNIFVYFMYNFKQNWYERSSQLSLFQVYVFIKLTIEIQSNINSGITSNSLTDSSKTLSKALVSESRCERLISSSVQKYTVNLVVKVKSSQTAGNRIT